MPGMHIRVIIITIKTTSRIAVGKIIFSAMSVTMSLQSTDKKLLKVSSIKRKGA